MNETAHKMIQKIHRALLTSVKSICDERSSGKFGKMILLDLWKRNTLKSLGKL